MMRLQIFELLRLLRTIEQDVMPVRGVEVLDCFQFKPGGIDLLLDGSQFFVGPQLVRVAGQTPAGIIPHRLIAGLIAAGRTEIVHQVDDQMRAAALFGESVMFAVQLMAIEPKSEFHLNCGDSDAVN